MDFFFWAEFAEAKGPQANTVHQRKGSWEQFLNEKMHFVETEDKKSVWLYSPTRYKPGAKRGKSGVIEMSALVYDLDDKDEEFIAALRSSLTGVEHVLHTSFSHLQPGKGQRFRLIVPLARAATVKEWKATQISFAQRHNFLWQDDEQTRHQATIFYWPSCPPGAPRELEHVKGRFTEVETNTVGVVVKDSKTAEGGLLTGTPGHHDNFIRRWASSEPGSDVHAWYGRFKAGLPIASVGGRDDALQKAVWCIANRMTLEQLHLLDEAVIVDFMAKSIAATPGPEDDRITADQVREKLRRARRDVLFDRTKGLNTLDEATAFAASLTTNVQEAPDVARAEDAKPVAPNAKWTLEDLPLISEEHFNCGKIKPVLYFKKSFFVFTKEKGFSGRLENEYVGSYGVREGLINCGIEPIGVKRGETFVRTGKDILDRYHEDTDIISRIEGSFVGHSRYNAETKVFTEVVNPMRRLEDKYDPEIDLFLRTYCAKERDYENLLAWLKRFPDLTLPNNVLFVYGPKNIGKSLLGTALCRFWGRESGTDPFSYFETFQDGFIECPFIVADEGLPKDMVNSNQIRKFATTGEHNVNRKNIPVVNWVGYARMVINANNLDELKFSKDVLNQESIEAIEARFLRIEVSESTRNFIAERGGRAWTETLVAGDRFIRHVEWLAKYHQHPQLSADIRFPAMTDPANRMHDAARLDQTLAEPACAIVWACLKRDAGGSTQKAWEDQKIMWREIQGRRMLCVSSNIVTTELWQSVMTSQNIPKPTPRKFGDALRLLSDAKIKTNDGGYQIKDAGRYWPLDLSLLQKWCVQSGISDKEVEKQLSPEREKT